MASNSEANLPSDFDIDEVINCWGEHINSSKAIGFELGQLGLPNNVKVSQNTSTNHASLPTASVVSSQQPKIPATKNTSQSLFVSPTNATAIHHQNNNNNHRAGFSQHQRMVAVPTPSFPSESLDIPSINLPLAPNIQMSRFTSGLMQNTNMANQMRATVQQLPAQQLSGQQLSGQQLPVQQLSGQQLPVQQLQTVQNPTNLLNENVDDFTDSNMDDSDDLIEGPLDKIVDQIMDRELNQAIMKTSTISNPAAYGGQHSSVASFPTMTSYQTPSATRGLNMSTSTITKPLTTPSENLPLLSKVPSPHSKSPFTLQPVVGTSNNLIRTSTIPKQAPVSVPLSNMSQPTTVPARKATSDIEELLKIQQSVRLPVNSSGQSHQFVNQHRAKAPGGLMTSSLQQSPVVVATTRTPSLFSYNQNTNLQMRMPTVMLHNMRSIEPQKNQTGVVTQTTAKNSSVGPVVSEKAAFVITPSTNSTIKDTPVNVITTQQRNNISTPTGRPSTVSLGMQQRIAGKQQDLSIHVSPVHDKEPALRSPHAIMQPTSTKPNPSQTTVTPNSTTGPQFSFFTTTASNALLQQPKIQKPVDTQSLNTFQLSSTSVLTKPSQPATQLSSGGTALKITSPSTNILSGLQQPQTKITNPNPSPQFKFFNQSSPVLTTTVLQANATTPMNTNVLFPRVQLSQSQSAALNQSKPMVFTLAPGSQSTATALKALPLITKEKLAGRQIFLLQQQPGQMVQTTQANAQNMKIVFVNEGSVPQVVSGVQKVKPSAVVSPIKVTTASTATATSVATTAITPQSSPATPALPAAVSAEPAASPGNCEVDMDSPSVSPSSNNSSESETIPIAALKQAEVLKRKAEEDHIGATKKRGRYKKKDPNKPVKPLSSFMKFFQKTQVSIRQKYPSASFEEVSQTAKSMWENLAAKEKKVYQDEWRLERAQYKKTLAAYEAAHGGKDITDGPSPEKNSSSPRIPASPVEAQRNTSPVPSSPTSSTSSLSSIPPAVPHGSGKPLAMMMANKTKMAAASAQSTGKVQSSPGASKSSSSKLKAPSNGIVDITTPVAKKKQKINPIPKKPCLRESCSKTSKTTKERGTLFCSNECVMLHCRTQFKSWVEARRPNFKTAVS